MTTDAEHGSVELFRCDRRGVVGVLRQRPMAGLAVDPRVPSILLLFENVAVASLARLMPGEVHRTCRQVGQGAPAEMSVLSEALRNQCVAEDEEEQQADEEDGGQPEKVPSVFEEHVHGDRSEQEYSSLYPPGCALYHWSVVRLVTGTSDRAFLSSRECPEMVEQRYARLAYHIHERGVAT